MLTGKASCVRQSSADALWTVRRRACRTPLGKGAISVCSTSRRYGRFKRQIKHGEKDHSPQQVDVFCRDLVLRSVNVGVLGALFNFGATPRPQKLGEQVPAWSKRARCYGSAVDRIYTVRQKLTNLLVKSAASVIRLQRDTERA